MVIDRYGVLNNYSNIRQIPKIDEPKNVVAEIKLRENIKKLTLSNKELLFTNVLVAHNISKFRRKSNSILLIPNVSAEIDKFWIERSMKGEL